MLVLETLIVVTTFIMQGISFSYFFLAVKFILALHNKIYIPG